MVDTKSPMWLRWGINESSIEVQFAKLSRNNSRKNAQLTRVQKHVQRTLQTSQNNELKIALANGNRRAWALNVASAEKGFKIDSSVTVTKCGLSEVKDCF